MSAPKPQLFAVPPLLEGTAGMHRPPAFTSGATHWVPPGYGDEAVGAQADCDLARREKRAVHVRLWASKGPKPCFKPAPSTLRLQSAISSGGAESSNLD